MVLTVVPDGADIKVFAGKRGMTLTANDLTHYQGERGRRGNKLPRGLQRVDSVEIEYSKAVGGPKNSDQQVEEANNDEPTSD